MLRYLLRFFAWMILCLRYKIEVHGLDEIEAGTLFLPNHSSELDPVILYCLMDGKVPLICLVAENIFKVPVIGWILKKIHALPIPNVDLGGNAYVKYKSLHALRQAAEVVRQKNNLLIYPSGGLKSQSKEHVGATTGVHLLLQELGRPPIVLVRTTGLWGSSFSRALTHASPDLGKQILHGFWMLVKNGFFFVPRRKVLIECEKVGADFPYTASKIELNHYLEEWFNRREDVLQLVREQFWSKKVPTIQKKKSNATLPLEKISQEIQSKVKGEVALLTKRSEKEIEPEMDLAYDLGMDSLDVVSLLAYLDEHFGVKGVQPREVVTVLDALSFAAQPKKGQQKAGRVKLGSWKKERGRPPVQYGEGTSIQEVFLRTSKRFHAFEAAADSRGVLTYGQLRTRALLLAKKIAALPGSHVGILLPATTMTMVLVLATLLAKKIPVMLNWTVGARSLKEIVSASSLQAIVTSDKFLSEAKTMDVESVDSLLVKIEEIAGTITLKEKLSALLLSQRSVEHILKRVEGEKSAVLLFTSGTENTPKGVPLTHDNILSNQRDAFSLVPFKASDVLHAFLPPFHSFGFSITGLLPLLCGLRVVFSPDPTDAVMLVRTIEQWKVTLLCAAPTFLKGILRAASPHALDHIRLVITGAEKAPADLFHAFGKAEVLEGYGITECGPILTINLPDKERRGVGKPLPHVSLITDNQGIIFARGPNIFHGYLQKNIPSPFVEIEGQVWYETGDIGKLDETGALHLLGRLKRFVKIGGEMINLQGLEEALLAKWPSKEEVAALAIVAKEKEGERPELILFATFPITLNEVNLALKEAGFSSLAKMAEMQRIESLPLLGTGKINYRALESLI